MLNGLPSSPVSGGGTPFPRNPRPTSVFPKAPDGREKGQRLPCKRAAITLQKSRNHIAKGQRSHCKRTAVAVQKAGSHIPGSAWRTTGMQRLPGKKPAATFLAAHEEQRECSGCRAKSRQPHSWQRMENNGHAAVAGQKAGNHIAKACKANCVRSVHGSIAMMHCALPPWRLVFLEGRGASEASYPA